jgi:hypothetical protein
MPVTIKRKTVQFNPDPKHVITRFFWPGDDNRARVIIQMVLALPHEERTQLFNQVLREFSSRHRNITKIFDQNFERVKHLLAELNITVESLLRNIPLNLLPSSILPLWKILIRVISKRARKESS